MMARVGVERFDLRTIAPRPWKNGAGLTREIATSPPDATLDAFDWRLSVAEVDREGPFSAFPGIDRCITLLRGAGLRLRSGDSLIDHRLDTTGAPFCFAGEAAIDATLLGGPSADLNVMTRRGRWRAAVLALRETMAHPGGDALMLLGLAGRWRVTPQQDAAFELQPSEGALWREPVRAVQVEPMDSRGSSCVLLVRLCHDHQS
jgi:environmental stress-induced protein Ves